MTGCTESSVGLVYRQLDETIDRVAPIVETLMQRIAPDAVVTAECDDTGHRFTVPIRFSDGIGRGLVVGRLFRYRDTVRLDIEISHNRMLAKPSGAPSDRRCYLNDFVASVTLPPGSEGLPPEFERNVVRGVLSARDAVQRHNRNHPAPWNQVKVAPV